MCWNRYSHNARTQIERRRFFNLLISCLAFQTTGVSILFTVFARKISTLGSGIEVFGLSATAFSVTALIAAPFMGMIADRFGRRILVLASLLTHSLAPLGYLLASSGGMFIGVRAVAGALTVGLIPATTSMIADVSLPVERGRWIGYVTGGSAIGFVVGPPLGGALYDLWGLAAPFFAAVSLSFVAFLIALILIPETGNLETHKLNPGKNEAIETSTTSKFTYLTALKNAVPRPYSTFIMLIVISFIAVFAWRFVEPQFHFYIYDVLGWTSARFGLCMSGYAVLYMLAETLLGRLSDRFGRKPVLIVGLMVHAAQYLALISTQSATFIALGIAISGFGEGLFMPALNAYYLDITPDKFRARVLGIKESVFSLAGLTGPALIVLVVQYVPPRGIFLIAGFLILFSAFLIPLMAKNRTLSAI